MEPMPEPITESDIADLVGRVTLRAILLCSSPSSGSGEWSTVSQNRTGHSGSRRTLGLPPDSARLGAGASSGRISPEFASLTTLERHNSRLYASAAMQNQGAINLPSPNQCHRRSY